GGVIRDILGTGLGAKPIMNTDVFCFGYLDMAHGEVPKGALHPLRTMRGVVSGVRDYGNRMGIPTANGALFFDERYTGNPLVYAGSIGIIPKDKVHKEAQPGDKIVAVGGRTGRDGIGGATFSSVELTEESEVVSSGAVQIGNAIQEKVVLDTLLQARDRDLYTCVTDCGAGGFSSAVGEMGEVTGARVELSACPLKYEGLSYREIWLSEAQERMVFAVPPAKLEEFLALFAAEDVETAVIGEFTGDGQMVATFKGDLVLDMPMSFLHDGLPKVERSAIWQGARTDRSKLVSKASKHAFSDAEALLEDILSSPNVCSKEYVVRQYDHEVQAMSAVKPLCGIYREGPSDAAAIVPKRGVDKALVVGCGLNPHYGDIDPYWMAMASIDEALRNVVATGGKIDHTAILDNFSWGKCSNPVRLGELTRACAACFVAAKKLGTPFISGKDSLSNEFATDKGTIAIPATLLITAASVTPITCLTTMDIKSASSSLWQIG
ncbi:MAG: phosphoribosylformylglycinamidine synthase, partial [Planctomycetes bacterium]|nr:phosphoribosylformylglycinamidine synthase [Planctomycetota bacterium]